MSRQEERSAQQKRKDDVPLLGQSSGSGKMVIENKIFDEERSLYGLKDSTVRNCIFAGPADGESPLKESSGITVEGCRFELRYPFWHDTGCRIADCTLTESCRAAMWYCRDLSVSDSVLGGIKALRECSGVTLSGVKADSKEFAWRCRDIGIENVELSSEYPFFECSGIRASGLRMKGKYSFQYTADAVVKNSVLDTKDAFWHSRNVTVTDSLVKGEYLGWYSEGLTLINCRISGTQPLCYAKGLTLINCTMEDTDLSFEKSEVRADIAGGIVSVKNPAKADISVSSIDEIIMDTGDPWKYENGRFTCGIGE